MKYGLMCVSECTSDLVFECLFIDQFQRPVLAIRAVRIFG